MNTYSFESLVQELNNLKVKHQWGDEYIASQIGVDRLSLRRFRQTKSGSFASICKLITFLKKFNLDIDKFFYRGETFEAKDL